MHGLFNLVRRDDPVFGSMLYMGDKLQYWEGKAYFAPIGEDIEVFIEGVSDDSMEQQRAFYETVCQRWAEWSAQITEQVRLSESDSREELQISSMSIPKAHFNDSIEWEVSFLGELSGNSYAVQMKGGNPASVGRDS